MKRLCGARLRCKPGLRCRKPAVAGKLRCRLHGGAARHGRHLSEDEHHSISFTKARAARGPLFPLDPVAAGKARAQQAIRATDGRFLPGTLRPKDPDAQVTRALRIIEKRMAEKTNLRAVPDDPDVDIVVHERSTAPREAPDAVPEPQAAATESSAQAPPGPDEAGELLEALMGAMLEAPSPFDDEGEDEGSSLWEVVASQLPDELYLELDHWLEERWG